MFAPHASTNYRPSLRFVVAAAAAVVVTVVAVVAAVVAVVFVFTTVRASTA